MPTLSISLSAFSMCSRVISIELRIAEPPEDLMAVPYMLLIGNAFLLISIDSHFHRFELAFLNWPYVCALKRASAKTAIRDYGRLLVLLE